MAPAPALEYENPLALAGARKYAQYAPPGPTRQDDGSLPTPKSWQTAAPCPEYAVVTGLAPASRSASSPEIVPSKLITRVYTVVPVSTITPARAVVEASVVVARAPVSVVATATTASSARARRAARISR